MRAEEFLPEHELVWSRKNGKPVLKWRCLGGQRRGRVVPDIRDCGKQLDFAKAQVMKKTRARTKIKQARKAKKTKRVNVASRILQQLNKSRRH